MGFAAALIDAVTGRRAIFRYLIIAGIGALTALGQAPWGLWPLGVLGLALGFGLCTKSPGWLRAALTGWAFGTGYFMVALSWIIEPFLVDVARHGWIAPFALTGLSAGMALFIAAGFAVARLAGGALAWIAALTLAEAARGVFFTGFPWAQLGHVWIETQMLQWAAHIGSLGLTAIMLSAAVGLWHLLARQYRLGGVALVAVAALYLTGPLSNRQGHPDAPDALNALNAPTVRLIQPNAAQHEKWDPEMIPIFFERQLEYTAAGDTRPDLIVWPETAVPVLLNNAGGTFEAIAQAAGPVPVVLGGQRLDDARLYNSLVMLDAGGQVATIYDKFHLVPFGEYVPYGDTMKRFGISGMASRDGNGYSAGPGAQVIDMGPLGKALPLICYEGVFPQDLRSAPERADFLLLITNDAWFGKVSGPYQHLAQARLRSVEQGLPMVRVANTGISAMIDARGLITAHLPLGQAGWLDAPLPAPAPPTLYARMGDLPILALMLLMLGIGVARNRRSPNAAH